MSLALTRRKLTQLVKDRGQALGFDLVGISRAAFLEAEAPDLELWLRKGLHGSMSYMSNYFDKRLDPRLLVPDARSVISVIHNYFPGPETRQPDGAPLISRYAWGEDYHTVLKTKLFRLYQELAEAAGTEVNGRVFVDSAPVMDKAWARRGGLGWIGKHTNLITPRRGSYFFIGEIILDLELDYDGPVRDYCGTCTRCLDACPTGALTPYQIDASRCISYLTIELKEEIPADFQAQLAGWAYGCDICQEVCPWNRFSKPHPGGEFAPLPHVSFTARDWQEITRPVFNRLARRSAMSRIRWPKLQQNIRAVLGDTSPMPDA
ncbi:MAG: tRNA epoxyqueuosine(34) reductase QueG [Bacteroidia bacterium]|nr:tRNA epoxyqueuosine(34) reductase QueG [Bacteroidia bacterium]